MITCPHCKRHAWSFNFVSPDVYDNTDDEVVEAMCPHCFKRFMVRKEVELKWTVL